MKSAALTIRIVLLTSITYPVVICFFWSENFKIPYDILICTVLWTRPLKKSHRQFDKFCEHKQIRTISQFLCDCFDLFLDLSFVCSSFSSAFQNMSIWLSASVRPVKQFDIRCFYVLVTSLHSNTCDKRSWWLLNCSEMLMWSKFWSKIRWLSIMCAHIFREVGDWWAG